MFQLEMKDLLEAGAHFGHQTKRWNPKMKPYIYGVRNGIHIIDLSKTLPMAQSAFEFITELVATGLDVLFVGTKRQAQDIVREEAERCGMYYVNDRWLGGTLTNFKTIKASIDRLHDFQTKKEDGTFAALTKKENLTIDREIERLEKSLGGIKNMTRVPGIAFLVDPKKERIALHESNILSIPVVAIADTNCDPENIDFLIPSNDDSIRAIRLIISKVADAVLAGKNERETRARQETPTEKPAVREAKPGAKGVAYVSRPESFEAEETVESFSATAETEKPEESKEETKE
jgi:small subunit ribosomal protein S2